MRSIIQNDAINDGPIILLLLDGPQWKLHLKTATTNSFPILFESFNQKNFKLFFNLSLFIFLFDLKFGEWASEKNTNIKLFSHSHSKVVKHLEQFHENERVAGIYFDDYKFSIDIQSIITRAVHRRAWIWNFISIENYIKTWTTKTMFVMLAIYSDLCVMCVLPYKW